MIYLKNNKAIIVAIVIVILAVGLFFTMSAKSPSTGIQKPVGTAVQNGSGSDWMSGTGSLADLLLKGSDLKCTYSFKDQADIKQSVYVSGNKARSDSTVKVDIEGKEQTMTSHMIIDGDTAYVWNDGSNMGVKIKKQDVAAVEDTDDTEAPVEEESYDDKLSAVIDYRCDRWSVDNSVFDLPKGVEFKDMEEELSKLQDALNMGTAGTPGVTDAQDMCGQCGNLPEGMLRDTCLEQAGCN